MNGGDLRFHISRKTFTEEAVRFWVAELGCALRYIHKQGIVHRDLKPDNVLLDSEGHVHLADFNVASDFTPGKPLTSKSGTLAYLAPEVYIGKGYSSEVDWWSLGVTFYECIYNKRPYEANSQDALAQAIVRAEPPFPTTSPPVSNVCLHAISSLLEKDKTRRIGASGFGTFTDNPFFRDINFDALERKEIEPIFCPSSEKTNFDATYDLEELLLEEAPLEARARKQKPRAELREDATQQEIRADGLHKMIETMFEPFNYTLLPQERAPVAPETTAVKERSISAERNAKDPEPALSRTRSEHPRSVPTPRSQTPGGTSRTRSPTQSPGGSPPLPANVLSGNVEQAPNNEYFPIVAPPVPPKSRKTAQEEQIPPMPTSPARSTKRTQGGRISSKGESSQGVSEREASASPTEESFKRGDQRPSGMLGFLSRKKGRDKSPKAKERGVLGKEGARMVVKEPKG